MVKSAAADAVHANQSSDKLLAMVEFMSRLDKPIRLQELAAALDMPTSTAHRYLSALQRRDYVAQREEDGCYFLTLKLCGVADSIQRHQTIINLAQPPLKAVAREFGETANLCGESNMLLMYNAIVPSRRGARANTRYIGHIAPLHCTAAGKLLLTRYSEQQWEALIARRGLRRLTIHTLTDRKSLQKELEIIRRQGFSLDNEECEIGVRCVAAPVYDGRGTMVAGLSVSGPTARMTDKHIQEHLPVLLRQAELLSQRLGRK